MSKTTKSKKTTAKPKAKDESDEYFTREEIKRLDKFHHFGTNKNIKFIFYLYLFKLILPCFELRINMSLIYPRQIYALYCHLLINLLAFAHSHLILVRTF